MKSSSSAPYPVLLCGSGYGRAYLAPLAASGDRLRLTGLLARGSERSRRLADRLGLERWDRLDDLDSQTRFAIACIALPTSADAVVLGLAERAMHVLCEHPRTPETLEALFEIADREGRVAHVNGHFVDLPAPRAFASRCRQLLADARPRRIEVVCQDRALYAAVDILEAALQPSAPPVGLGSRECLELDPPRFDEGGAPAREFVDLRGRLWGSELSMVVQVPTGGAADGSSEYVVDVRLAVVFDRGTLLLLGLAGPVVWTANLFAPSTPPAAGSEERARSAGHLAEILTPPASLDQFQSDRDQANREALDRLVRAIEGLPLDRPEDRVVERGRTLGVARLWQRLGAVLQAARK